MEKKEIGRFYATTFDERVYEFIVYDNKTIDCPLLNAKDILRMRLKPRFNAYAKDDTFYNFAPVGRIDGLIRDFDIDEVLFNYLKDEHMIMYSTDMAYLYNFVDKDGYDKKWRVGKGKEFKHARKKGEILTKWKKGEFN